MKINKLLPLLLSFCLFSVQPTFAQEFMDMENTEENLEFIDDSGNIEEYEDYIEEGQEEYIVSDLNNRVKYFDIAGVMLGQNLEKVKEALKDRKYKQTDIEYTIPEYFRYNYDAICREKDIVIPENLDACIKGLAKKDKMEYISRVDFTKHDTEENISVYFTSPITDNKVWKVVYTNKVNEKYGPAKNFQYQREERRRAFWYYVLSKYGQPNVEPNRWVYDINDNLSEGLTANFGSLELSNPKQNAFDISESVTQARRDFKYTDYSF